jgi:tetratricopeptide (TPR) repeat protein
MPRLFALVVGLSLVGVAARAADRVTVAAPEGSAPPRVLTGTIDDYNGLELRLILPSGQPFTTPAARVRAVETVWNEQHVAADRLRGERKYDEAIESYRAALRGETRPWGRRVILAEVVTCFENLGQYDRAGDIFVQLMKADEHHQYLERIPLPWRSGAVDPAIEQRAKVWLAQSDLPPAQLLGAGWLLSGAQRAEAVATLRRLSNSLDARIGHLADAQTWRANIATVGPQELQAWELQIARMPENLRAGPYLTLGRGWLQQNARMSGPAEPVFRRAATSFLKTAVLFPDRPQLAAQGFEQAALALEGLAWHDEATSALREAARDFPDTEAGRLAAEKLRRAPLPDR